MGAEENCSKVLVIGIPEVVIDMLVHDGEDALVGVSKVFIELGSFELAWNISEVEHIHWYVQHRHANFAPNQAQKKFEDWVFERYTVLQGERNMSFITSVKLPVQEGNNTVLICSLDGNEQDKLQ